VPHADEPDPFDTRLVRKIQNRFYLNSLVAQVLFVQLREHIETHYESPPSSKRFCLQAGYAWACFSKLFEPLSAIEKVRLFENLLRFSNDESYPPARSFFLAYAPVSFEHDMSGKYIGPGVWKPEAGSRVAALRVHRTLRRWCDWLEALVHFQVHQLHYPAGSVDLDKAIILLWPLFTQYRWSFDSLLEILRSRTVFGKSLPFETGNQLAAYCKAKLRLHGNSPRKSADISIDGLEVAERLLKFLPSMR
jgi:hypothetical protein